MKPMDGDQGPEEQHFHRTLRYFLASALIVADLVLNGIASATRDDNAFWRHFNSRLQMNVPLQTDPSQYIMTRSFLETCEIAHVIPCYSHNSNVVRAIYESHMLPVTSSLLREHQY